MSSPELLIWWTDGDDYRAVGDRAISLPDYLRDEFRSRYGRVGRGRLWIPEGIPLHSIAWDDSKPLARLIEKHSYGGVVFRSWDLPEVIALPGFVTDLEFNPIGA